MFKRVLLAYDGTPEGVQALREGALLAKACRAKIYLLSVAPYSANVSAVEADGGGAVSQLTDAYQELLEKAAERLRALGFDPEAKIAVGEPAPTIGGVAREIGADLVVVGHRRQGLLSRWWSGSTSAYLSDHVGCSVLISTNALSEEDFEAEARGVQPG